MANTVIDFIKKIPIVTRCYLFVILIFTILCHFGVLSPFDLCLYWKHIIHRRQLWRLFTSFFYLGDFSISFALHLYFFFDYSRSLEENYFSGKSGDFLFFLLFSGSLSLVSSFFKNFLIYFSCIESAMIYLWSRHTPDAIVRIFGIIAIPARYLPVAIVVLNFFMGSSVASFIVGIIIGHSWYFLRDVLPPIKGINILKTPRFLHEIFNRNNQPQRFQGIGQRTD
eukprot:TRINITY_DN564_c0_g1_i1.p1 TRINITY_DN564_c0_g1~~TRINITY_DN564_c0_g1_i1.p1  ORF type:complete len:225 (+),score=38.92 TRINITY_DN564_c0_g1_i1:58-732(+)